MGSSAIALAKIYQSGLIFTLAGSEASRDYLIQQFEVGHTRGKLVMTVSGST